MDQALISAGVAGLVPSRRGLRGASKLTPALAARIVELDAAGQTLRQIAAATGVSTFTVRNALGRVRPGGQAPVAGRLCDGYYGLAATLLTLVFLALADEPRAEGATRVPPAALGLDRAAWKTRS